MRLFGAGPVGPPRSFSRHGRRFIAPALRSSHRHDRSHAPCGLAFPAKLRADRCRPDRPLPLRVSGDGVCPRGDGITPGSVGTFSAATRRRRWLICEGSCIPRCRSSGSPEAGIVAIKRLSVVSTIRSARRAQGERRATFPFLLEGAISDTAEPPAAQVLPARRVSSRNAPACGSPGRMPSPLLATRGGETIGKGFQPPAAPDRPAIRPITGILLPGSE